MELTPEDLLRLMLVCDQAKDLHLPYSEELYASAQIGKKRFMGAILKLERSVAARKELIKPHQ